jgi:hypothetical protein
MDGDDGEPPRTRRWVTVGCVTIIGACLVTVGAAAGGWPFLALAGIAAAFIIATILDG